MADDDSSDVADPGAATDGADGDLRLWLVDRQYRDKNLITLVYATTDGERHLRKQLSYHLLQREPVTAAITVPDDRPEATPPEDRERYATQASRMASDHAPDDEV